MGRPSKTKNQKKERAAAVQQAQQDFGTVPHSFVFHRGRVGKNVRQLILDVRKVMEPYTARALKVRKKNSMKDFVAVAGPLGVTHFLVFSKSTSSINFKLFRLPGGPTLTFKVMQYSLIKDVVSSLKRHRMHEQQFTQHPLLVLSNFGLQQIHVKLMASMFQNMFPSINVHKVNLNNIKRCLLISYDAETQLLDFRHYSVKVVPVGVSKGLKKLLQEKFPNMSRLEDISELLVKDINLSESEAEQDGTHNTLELPQAYAGRGNMKAQQSAVRLTEIGPRMTLQLVKVEEGLAQGNVLFHSFIHKTEEEVQEILARKEAKLKLKTERRQQQEAAVERKRQQREAHREKSLAGIRRKRQQDGDSDAEDPGAPEQQDAAGQSDESDAEYYRQELGQEPDEDLFPNRAKRPRGPSGSAVPRKRRRRSQQEQPGAPKPRPVARKRGPARTDSKPQGAAGRKTGRGSERPAREGQKHGPKRQGKLLARGKIIFRRPGHGKKGKQLELPACASGKGTGPSRLRDPKTTPGMANTTSGSPCANFSRSQEALWPVLAAQFPLALLGNALAVFRLARERPWPAPVVYSFHLSVSGALYSLSLPALAAYYRPPKRWSYGAALCKLERFLFNCNLYGSTFFVACISLNRYLGIVYPLRLHGRLRSRHAQALSAAVWVLAAGLSAPTFVFSELQEEEGTVECLGSAARERLPRYIPYSLLLATLGCALPFLLTAFCYGAVARVVFRNPHLSPLEKRRIGVLVGASVALYAFSYLPYHVFRNLNLWRRRLRPALEDCGVSRAVHAAAQLGKILVNFNICLHPLLYAALADSVRCCCCCCKEQGESLELQPRSAAGARNGDTAPPQGAARPPGERFPPGEVGE
ncbi:suppressor of SWI4 1 homolog [Aythya fuligula]|uniref:Suppressor of SWI4 1 homolog n=2 Tax=Anatidae TaxID=8830 RepID=A0A6J3EAY3_AYTFU|nr:suppressor of SWI4 1 homolog [Aythya fuligula]